MERLTHSHFFGAFMGFVVGDALGVPVEFRSRKSLDLSPVVDFQGGGTHSQPAGTWSDDSSLVFCLVESILEGFTLEGVAEKIQRWYTQNYWTPHGVIFDIGISTRNACERLVRGHTPETCGEQGEYANGNGALMRVWPLAFLQNQKKIAERFEEVSRVARLTHGQLRSSVACFMYTEMLRELSNTVDKHQAWAQTQQTVREFAQTLQMSLEEKEVFSRLFEENIAQLPRDEVFSSGYVIHTLEASLWAFLNSDNYSEAVLRAVNLGDDTDTIGALTGSLTGYYFGYQDIAQKWIAQLALQPAVSQLGERFATYLVQQTTKPLDNIKVK
jgi:ADP-ribosyl-[dinitrogen reductase] hydrolase